MMTLLLGAPLFFGCGTKGEGTVVVAAYGEDFIEEGIPADEVDDGWEIVFSRFDVQIEGVKVGGVSIDVAEAVDVSGPSSGEGHEIGSGLVSEGDHTGPSFTIARVEIDGSASKDEEVKAFSWVFDSSTAYANCQTTTSVSDGGTVTFEITIHADHLFYDSLVSEEPELLFQALADADSNENGEITEAELRATDIGTYDPGSEGGVNDLWSWLIAQIRTLGHVDGEGHCDAAPLQ